MIRKLICCLAAIAFLATNAVAGFHGGTGTPVQALTSRSLLSLNYTYNNPSYAWINFFNGSNATWYPYSSSWATGQAFNASLFDASGNLTYSYSSGEIVGAGLVIPPGTEYSGTYCLDSGDTTHAQSFTLNSDTASWSQASNTTCANGSCTGSGVTISGSNKFVISGTNWCIPLTFSGTGGFIHITMTANDPSATGAYERDVRLYEQPDATDLANGLVFRRAFKQPLVNLDPGFIRFVNWDGPGHQGDAIGVRFENRMPVLNGAVSYAGFNVCGVVPYTDITGTDAYSLAAGTASGCSSLSTPGALTHGDIVTARVDHANSQGNCTGGVCPAITAITNATEAVVTTATAHGFVAGEVVYLFISNAGMPTLNLFPVTIQNDANLTSTTFGINFNSTSAGTFNSGTCGTGTVSTCSVMPYISLNLNGMGARPIVQENSVGSIALFGSTSFSANAYITLVYDKLMSGLTDGSGNPIQGVWHSRGSSSFGPINWSAPIEMQVELINELNAMLPNGRPPINMWFNLPFMSMVSIDPDYSSGSEYPVNALNTILNGANGYAGLCAKCSVILEMSDETWNTGYPATYWFTNVGLQRWGTSLTSASDFTSYSTFRLAQIIADVKASPYYNSRRVFFDDGGQQVGTVTTFPNLPRIYGDYAMLQDAQWPGGQTSFTGSQSGTTLTAVSGLSVGETVTDSSGSLAKPTTILANLGGGQYTVSASKTVGSETMIAAEAPMAMADIFSGGAYFVASSTVIDADITQCSNDAATYGIPSSQVTADVNQIADDTATTGGSQTIASTETQNANFAAVISVFGTNKYKGDYEGGLGYSPTGYTGVCPNCAAWSESCINLVYQSQEWANQQQAYFNSFKNTANLAVPGVYLLNNYSVSGSSASAAWEWSNGYTPDSYSGGVEGAGITLNFTAMTNYNAGLSN